MWVWWGCRGGSGSGFGWELEWCATAFHPPRSRRSLRVKLALRPLGSEPRGTIFLNLAWLRTAALALRRLISRGTLARVALAQRLGIPPSAATQRQHGIDCACYYTENLFVRSPVEGHFCFEGRTAFERRERPLLESLSFEARDELLSRLEAEAARRRGIVPAAAARKARVAAECSPLSGASMPCPRHVPRTRPWHVPLRYSPLHPELWTLRERWLHRDFVALVEQARERRLRADLRRSRTLPDPSRTFRRNLLGRRGRASCAGRHSSLRASTRCLSFRSCSAGCSPRSWLTLAPPDCPSASLTR